MSPLAGNTSDIRVLARYHFLAGLPRSGVSVLASLLNQNPRFHVGKGGPAQQLLENARNRMFPGGPEADLLDDAQKIALLRGIMAAVYHDRRPDSVVFDAHPLWLEQMDLLVSLYPLCRFIVCVRNPAWIVNSMMSGNPDLEQSGPAQIRFIKDQISAGGDVGQAMNRLRRALSSRHSERMLLIDYDRLTEDPELTMEVIYDFLREPEFRHDFSDISGFDENISGPVIRSARPTVLSARSVLQLSGRAFWRNLRNTSATMLLGRGG